MNPVITRTRPICVAVYSLIHSEPSMKLREIKGLASSSVSSLDHDTLPAKLAPDPVHLYCP